MRTVPHTQAGSERKISRTFPKLAVWPIRTESDYERTREVVDKLILLEKPSREEGARLEIMLTLMEAWEAEHHRIDTADVTSVEILKTLLQDHGMSASDLGRLLGSRSLGSAILLGKRQLSKRHIRILCDHFQLGPSAFLNA